LQAKKRSLRTTAKGLPAFVMVGLVPTIHVFIDD
jgi:hypothetical protein